MNKPKKQRSKPNETAPGWGFCPSKWTKRTGVPRLKFFALQKQLISPRVPSRKRNQGFITTRACGKVGSRTRAFWLGVSFSKAPSPLSTRMLTAQSSRKGPAATNPARNSEKPQGARAPGAPPGQVIVKSSRQSFLMRLVCAVSTPFAPGAFGLSNDDREQYSSGPF